MPTFSKRSALPPALIAAALLLALPTTSYAAPLFSAPSQRYEVGGNPSAVTIADLDADGWPDVVMPNFVDGAGMITVLYGRGDGTFRRRDFEIGIPTYSVAIGDLNGDELPDLVTANSGPSAFSVLLGSKDGTYSSRADFGSGAPGSAASVAIADMTGDGHPDVVTGRAVHAGNGDGTFGAGTAFTGIAEAIGDLDRDGRLDLVTNGGYDPDPDDFVGVASVLRGNGDGTFQPGIDFETGLNPWSMAVSDFNRDGQLDVVVANEGHTPDYLGTISVRLGRGDGTFGIHRLYDTGTGPHSVAVADLNNDGRPDVVTVNSAGDPDWGSNSLSIFLGNGDGSFRVTRDIVVDEYPQNIAIADLDRDGSLDLVTSSWIERTVSVLLGNGDGTFGARPIAVAGDAWSLAAGDLNGDGHVDVATANGPYTAGTVSVALGNGDGTFRARSDRWIGTARDNLTMTDLNGDGRLDLAMTIYGGFNGEAFVSAMLGNGDGTFGAITNHASGSASWALGIGDLNADGRPDAVTANVYPSTVAVLLGNGDGTFGARTEYSTGLNPNSIAIGDLNADGRPDLATYNTYYPQTISILLGRGDGSFEPRTDLYPGGNGASNGRSMAISDVNEDGRLDLVLAGFTMLGNGDGTFGSRINTPVFAGETAIADFDRDGRLDQAATFSSMWSGVRLVLGNGDGTFANGPLFGAGGYPTSPVVADFNEDGRPDLAVADGYLKEFTVLLNQSGAPAPIAFDLTSPHVNLISGPEWVAGMLEPESPLAAADIDVASIRLNGVPLAPGAPVVVGDHDGDGVSDLTVSFDRAALALTLVEGDGVRVDVTATAKGRPVAGADFIRPTRRPPLRPGRGPSTGRTAAAEADPRDEFAAELLAALAVRAAGASPVRDGRLRVELALPVRAPARLELMDVAGRTVISRDLGSLGAGRHSLELASGRAIAPGVYFLRLAQGVHEARTSLVVLR